MFSLTVFENEKETFKGDVARVTVETEKGPLVILKDHQPYMSKIKNKIIFQDQGGADRTINVNEGIVYTNGKKCFVIIDN